MRSSSGAFLLAALLTVWGCAATVRRGEAPAGGAAGTAAKGNAGNAAGTQAPAAAPEGEGAPGSSPARPWTSGAPERLDPSEEVTPEELATIPEPVPRAAQRSSAASGAIPGADGAAGGSSHPEADSKSPGASGAPSVGAGDTSAAGEAGWSWQVQIYATESAEDAERVAREAEARLGVPAAVIHEGSLHKVRLGRFATEGEAQSLRERAVGAGYNGAFRTRAR